jgi:hypothetical protein
VRPLSGLDFFAQQANNVDCFVGGETTGSATQDDEAPLADITWAGGSIEPEELLSEIEWEGVSVEHEDEDFRRTLLAGGVEGLDRDGRGAANPLNRPSASDSRRIPTRK